MDRAWKCIVKNLIHVSTKLKSYFIAKNNLCGHAIIHSEWQLQETITPNADGEVP